MDLINSSFFSYIRHLIDKFFLCAQYQATLSGHTLDKKRAQKKQKKPLNNNVIKLKVEIEKQ